MVSITEHDTGTQNNLIKSFYNWIMSHFPAFGKLEKWTLLWQNNHKKDTELQGYQSAQNKTPEMQTLLGHAVFDSQYFSLAWCH